MTEQQFKEVLERYEKGTATPAEVEQVEAFYHSYVQQALDDKLAIIGNADERKGKILQYVYTTYRKNNSRKILPTAWRIAASIALIVTTSLGIYFWQQRDSTQQVAAVNIPAGGNRAVLQLEDNTTIALDSIYLNTIPMQGGAQIINNNGRLAYSQQQATSEIIFNKIITPRGGQYQVTLSDGSKVWLNAASSLRYPVAFNTDERIVELTGEAYFEIAKDATRPFKVSLPEMQVEVLGTHFNIMAYKDESAIKTTLVEGSVSIKNLLTPHHATSPGTRLTPGQQAQLNEAGNIQVLEDPELIDQALAWKSGMFSFDNTDLTTIMRQVARWYDVDIEYEPSIENVSFVGRVSRKANVTEVLKVIELTGVAHFEIHSNLIRVKSGPRPSHP